MTYRRCVTYVAGVALLGFLAVGTAAQAQNLQLYLTSNSDVVAPSERITYTATVANTGATALTDVSAQVILPQFTTGAGPLGETFGCTGGGICTWTIGTLSPGNSRVLHFVTTVQSTAAAGDITTQATASATGSSSVTKSVVVTIEPVRLMRISLAPESTPAEAAEPFSYTLTYGNAGTEVPTDVVLSMPIPDGTVFTSADLGGVLDGETVTWRLGTVAPGSGGQRRLTVTPDAGLADGAVIEAWAEIDSGLESDPVVRSSATTAIWDAHPIQVHFGVSQTVAAPGDRIFYDLTVTNTGSALLTNVTGHFVIPQFALGASAVGETFGCTGGGLCTWTIGLLHPGQGRTLPFASLARNDAPPGEIVRMYAAVKTGGEDQALAMQDLIVDPLTLMRVSLAQGPGPVIAGEPFTYTVTFGNAGTTISNDVELRLDIPENTVVVEAPCGAEVNDESVVWNLGTLLPGIGGQFSVRVMPDAALPDGYLLKARAGVSEDTTLLSRSINVTPVTADVPLALTFNSNRISASPLDQIIYELSVTNNGVVNLTSVSAGLFVPDFVASLGGGTGFGCTGGGLCTWTVGTLAPDQTQVISIVGTLRSDAPAGDVSRTRVTARDVGTWQRTYSEDVLSGARKNLPPSGVVIVSPENDAAFVIGGAEGEDPLAPDSVFAVEWSETCDPENDPITYRWQLSSLPDFGSLLLDEPSGDDGSELRFETDFGTLAQLLSDNGTTLGQSVTLHHRVVASDGISSANGEGFRVEFTRGTIVGSQGHQEIPKEFALRDNYPNPFNPTTTFVFDLPRTSAVELAVFDVNGRKLATVVSEHLPAGTWSYVWDAGALASGVYLYQLKTDAYTKTKKLTLLR